MIINIRGSHLVARLNGVSVCWHVLGVAVIVGVLIFAPDKHASVDFVFTEHAEQLGLRPQHVLVVRAAARLPADAVHDHRLRRLGAHLRGDARRRRCRPPKGVWQSVFYSAVIGYILLLAITFAAATRRRSTRAAARSSPCSRARWARAWVKLVLIIAVVGQLFCGMSCMTSASRMMYAFSRDGAVPGWRIWSRVNERRIPFNAVIAVAVLRADPHAAGAEGQQGRRHGRVHRGRLDRRDRPLRLPTSIPIFLRWRMGDAFEPGPWNLGQQVQVDDPRRAGRGPRSSSSSTSTCRSARPACRGRATSTGRCSTTRRS